MASRPSLALFVATNIILASAHRFQVYRGEVGRADYALFAIGDTHGKPTYLCKSLLATGKFQFVAEVQGGCDEPLALRWLGWKSCEELGDGACAPGQSEPPFGIHILGDIIDRGMSGLYMLTKLRKLSSDPARGHLLNVMLGNHESMALRNTGDRYAVGDLDVPTRRLAFLGLNAWAEGAQTFNWLRTLDVIALDHGVLLCHGGLSHVTLERVTSSMLTEGGRPVLPSELITAINGAARAFYAGILSGYRTLAMEDTQQFLSGEPDGDAWNEKLADAFPEEPAVLSTEAWGLDENAGVLWFRGYSQAAEIVGMKIKNYSKLPDDDAGVLAGTRRSCFLASEVAKQFGAHTMVVAHTTHLFQTEYCSDGGTPVFAVDTNADVEKADQEDDAFQPYLVDHAATGWLKSSPQTLRLVDGEAAACRAGIEGVSTVECRGDAIARIPVRQ